MSNGPRLTLRHLPASLRGERQASSSAIRGLAGGMPDLNLRALESDTIRRALERTDSNRTEAAKLLGISRRTLQRKLKEIEDKTA